MILCWLKRAVLLLLLTTVMAVVLFSGCSTWLSGLQPILHDIAFEAEAACRDAGTQWLVFACCAVYFVTFVLVEQRSTDTHFWRFVTLNTWLTALVILVALRYAFGYGSASGSTDSLVMLAGAVLGKGAAAWASFKRGTRSAESGIDATQAVLVILVFLLVAGVFLGGEAGRAFEYRGQNRWSGPWDNPNTFGMLMGVGCVLAVGQAMGRLKAKGQSRGSAECGMRSAESESLTGDRRSSRAASWAWIQIVLFGSAAVVCGIGLIKSYSRGAWVGAAVGFLYLARSCWRARSVLECGDSSPLSPDATGRVSESVGKPAYSMARFPGFLRRNWLPASAILVSVLLLTFWNFRHTEQHLVRRAFSFGNVNDFSWRNRVAAYQGSLQMMADRPWLGFGWNQTQRVYDQLYRGPQVAETAAIQLNDYFMLGTTLGVPTLVCFVVYVGLSLTRSRERGARSGDRKAEDKSQQSEATSSASALRPLNSGRWLPTVCRAGAVVLLVGFWFDGGLFKLATGSVFWILLELGRSE